MLWVIALGVIVFLYACLIERNWYAIRKTELEMLKPGAQPIVVLHISDLHLAPWQKRKVRWIQQIAERVKPRCFASRIIVRTFDLYKKVSPPTKLRRMLVKLVACFWFNVAGSLLN